MTKTVINLIRGDSFPETELNLEPLVFEKDIYSMRSHLRTPLGLLLAELPVALSAEGVLSIGPLPYTVTERFPVGAHQFDVELTFVDGLRTTVTYGEILVKPDVSRD